MNNAELIAAVVGAIIGTLGFIKFKLLEEFVKKIAAENSKVYTFLLITVLAISVGTLAMYFPVSSSEPLAEEGRPESNVPENVPKSDLEAKVDAAKEVVELTREVGKAIKDNRVQKDSIFRANQAERWAYSIGDWTDDEDGIAKTFKTLSSLGNIKLLKEKKRYLFIKDDVAPKEVLELSIDSIRLTLPGHPIDILDLKNKTTRRNYRLVERTETFGKRRNKVEITCLIVD